MAIKKLFFWLSLTVGFGGGICPAFAEEYEVVPPRAPARWNLWVGEGLSYVSSVNQTFGNRFRIGGEMHFLRDYRLILGLALFDTISSGETANTVGDLSRSGSDLEVGYFLVPDLFWVRYSLVTATVTGRNITGGVSTTGHGLSLGYRVINHHQFNLTVELSYLYILLARAVYYDPVAQTYPEATYPPANVVGLNFRIGFDSGLNW